MSSGIATIGYQAATVDSFLRALRDAGVGLLVDVRAVASSRFGVNDGCACSASRPTPSTATAPW